MDKNKLLNNLKSRRDAWNESLINTMKENIKSIASVKILEDIIAEVEEDKKPDFLSLDEIVKGMKDYCELVYKNADGTCNCKKCPFAIWVTSALRQCVKDTIEENINKAKTTGKLTNNPCSN